VLLGFVNIRGSYKVANIAGIIHHLLARYRILDRILFFITDSARNNPKLILALNNSWSLLSVDWPPLEYHMLSMTHVVQLVRGPFLGSIMVKGRDGHLGSSCQTSDVKEVMTLDNGFHKTVET